MARTRVYPPLDSPKRNEPGFLKTADADDLVALGRADRLTRNSIRLRPLAVSNAVEVASGYDGAASSNPVSGFLQAWVMRKSGGIDMFQLKSTEQRA